MLEIKMDKVELIEAEKQAKEMGNIAHSITKGQGNIAGFLAELAVAKYYGASQKNTYNYDLVMPNGTTIDVKAKRTTVKPRPNYECSVAAYNTKQNCDYYSFCRVSNDFKIVWLLGTIKKEEYLDKSKKKTKGDIDPSNNFIFKADCYNLKISDLPTLSKTL